MKKPKKSFLNPSLFSHYYLEGAGRVRKLKEVLTKTSGEREHPTLPLLLLDLGGRESLYESLAQELPLKWISVDMKKYGRTDVVLKGEDLPFKAGVFDAVLCTQVFGCIPDLFAVTREIHRILRPHGFAILTEAAIFPPYGEGARWRILPEGWKTLLERFGECRIEAELNTVASFFRVLNLYLAVLLQNVPLLETVRHYSFCPFFNLIGRWANGRFRDIGFAANYFVVARK